MKMNEIYYDFKDVREHDMDFMMMEEFCASQEFANLFLAKVGKAGAEVVRVLGNYFILRLTSSAPYN